ncbi:MAG TPA: hypothetical protein VGG61_16520, partial [Gemmataceae bacterium]
VMVCPRFAGSLIVLVVLCTGLTAAENPEIKVLRNEITALRAQEKAVLNLLRAQYETYVKIDKLSEKELAAERETLAKQEKELLAVATTSEDRDAIKAQYKSLHDALNLGTKIDANQIREIRALEKVHTKLVGAAFNAKIKELEAAIQILERAKTGKK